MTPHQDTSTERDLVANMRVLEADHEPDGWPAVRMSTISALCDEIERLRAALASRDEAAQQPQGQELQEMEARKDAAYLERNQVVAALAKCFPSGIARTAIEGWSEDWHGCVYIDLPTGQASWHFHDSHAYLFDGLPPYQGKWDGHTTEEKYARLAALKTQGQAVSDEEIDAALRDIDHVARYYEVYEYGLPVHLLDGADFPDYKDVAEGMRQPIRAILALRDGPESGITAKEQGNGN